MTTNKRMLYSMNDLWLKRLYTAIYNADWMVLSRTCFIVNTHSLFLTSVDHTLITKRSLQTAYD